MTVQMDSNQKVIAKADALVCRLRVHPLQWSLLAAKHAAVKSKLCLKFLNCSKLSPNYAVDDDILYHYNKIYYIIMIIYNIINSVICHSTTISCLQAQ